MPRFKTGNYKSGSYHEVSNKTFNIIMCEDKIVIPLIPQKYVLSWYSVYLLNPGLDIIEAIICQHL